MTNLQNECCFILTDTAISKSNIKNLLITNIGFSKDFDEILEGKDRNNKVQLYTIKKWLQEGSTDEDALNRCRASNHFHNPIHSGDWRESQMSDSVFIDDVCGTTNRYSDVTWATGFVSPGGVYIKDRIGQYLYYGGFLADTRQDMGWDDARSYIYDALTSPDPAVRKEKFVNTFKAVGQVMHLLQDMAVPAHVRNDMSSHLINKPFWNTSKWGSNPFEKYVVTHPGAINDTPVKPVFTVPMRHTDFWDKNSYTGDNPTAGTNQGLAEYTNANFVSDFTIFKPVSDTAHYFKYPSEATSVDKVHYTIADPINPAKTITRTYYQKTRDGDDGYRLAGVDFLNRWSMSSTPLKRIAPMDDYVHEDYAKKLLPRTVGYSAALLDYFFRGKIEVKRVSTGANFITFSAKNTTTNGDAMTGGTLDLVLRYRSVGDPDQLFKIVPFTDYQYLDVKLSGNQIIDATTKEFTFDLSATPLPDWANDVTAFFVYHGQLGNEAGAVAVGQTVLRDTPRKMTLALPTTGVYAKTDGSTGFSQITVAATSNIPGLDLADGLIELVMIHRTSDSDPFQGARVTTSPADPLKYRYIRASEQTGKRSLVQGVKTELTFDISDNPLPIWASDVYMYISYKKAGDPDAMTRAVGYLDISEPTPIDVFNNADKICMNNQWYDAGSPAAIALVDTNNNGMAEEVDVYPNNIANIFYKASSIVTSTLASDTDYTLNASNKLLGGSSRRLGYILTDYNFNSSFMQDWVDGPNFWGEWTTTESNTGTAVKHQTDPDGSFTYPGMQTVRGNKIWWGAGIIYDNQNYPLDSPDCSWDAL